MLPVMAATLPTSKPEDVGISSERLQRIDQMIQRRIDAREMAGAVAIVARKGKIVHFQAVGMRDLESKQPMTKDTIFRIASMTKPITGVAIMMMIEEGRVRLTDPVSRYIPEFKNMKVAIAQPSPQGRGGAPAAGAAPGGRGPAPLFYTIPAEREITIRDLLTHVSGLASGPMSNSETQKLNRRPDENLASYIPRLGTTPLEFQPGSRWSYSAQAGFDTLGRIVEIATRRELFDNPRHPYTKALLAAVPSMDLNRRAEQPASLGDPPDPTWLPTGCRFRSRCPIASEPCARIDPALIQIDSEHEVACLAVARAP